MATHVAPWEPLASLVPWEQYDRIATPSSEGHFHVDSLPAGDYFVACYVVPQGSAPAFWLADSITVATGDHGTAVLRAPK